MTSKFFWLDEYNVGDDTIDQQHQYLFELANQIVDPTNDAQKTHLTILSLFHYVREHFQAEESLMKLFNCPDYDEHVREHEQLTRKLNEVSSGIISGEVGPDDIMTFMNKWLLEHILKKDMAIGNSIRQQNIKPAEASRPSVCI